MYLLPVRIWPQRNSPATTTTTKDHERTTRPCTRRISMNMRRRNENNVDASRPRFTESTDTNQVEGQEPCCAPVCTCVKTSRVFPERSSDKNRPDLFEPHRRTGGLVRSHAPVIPSTATRHLSAPP